MFKPLADDRHDVGFVRFGCRSRLERSDAPVGRGPREQIRRRYEGELALRRDRLAAGVQDELDLLGGCSLKVAK